ncbi:MAG TPA: transposase [Thermoplasmata archaeon]|nr:transposase [Thermoplasmata archaeon]
MYASTATPSARETRALEMLAAGIRVAESKVPGEYIVPSESGCGFYLVRIPPEGVRPAECSCPDFEAHAPAECKHIIVVRRWIDVHHPPIAQAPKRRRRQNASAFNKAQMEEGHLFPILLQDLCANISEPARDPHRPGHPPIPLRDQFFCAIQQAYSGLSGKLSNEDRRQAADQKFIQRAPYSDVTSKALLREESTSILVNLLARSVEPFRALETKCAIDSTGFRTTRFHYYRNEKYTPTRTNEWLKVHALVGVSTHAVLAAEITSGHVGDSPQFKVLLQRVANAGFELNEVLADKAYNSRANFEIADKLGIQAFIPFKSNQSGQSRGSLPYHEAYLLFKHFYPKFQDRYRYRGQVEVAFSSLKQVIGETVRSRRFTSQVNEVLCKLIAYNITRVIHTLYSMGIIRETIRSKTTAPTLDAYVEDLDHGPRPHLPNPVPAPIPPAVPFSWTPVVLIDSNSFPRSAWTLSR